MSVYVLYKRFDRRSMMATQFPYYDYQGKCGKQACAHHYIRYLCSLFHFPVSPDREDQACASLEGDFLLDQNKWHFYSLTSTVFVAGIALSKNESNALSILAYRTERALYAYNSKMTQQYVDPFGAPWSFAWIRLLCQWRGGIFQMLWVEWLIAVSVCALALTGVYLGWKDDQDGLRPSIQSLYEAVTFVARRFQAAIALMLGFYTMQAFNRWREARNIEGDAMGAINNLALQISGRIRDNVLDDVNEEQDDGREQANEDNRSNGNNADTKSNGRNADVINVRLKLIRFLNLSHALVVGDVYEMKHNAFASLDNLVNYGLATPKEARFLGKQESRYKYVAPIMWYINLLENLQRKDLYGVDAGTVNALSGGAVQIRRLLADLYGVKDLPIPLSYRQLTNMTVRLYMIFLLIAAILFEMSQEGYYESISRGSLSRGSFWIIMVYAFEYFLFIGWLTVADAIQNPFRSWADQLDWDDYVKEINASSILIATQFHGEAAQVDLDDDDSSDDDIPESEKMVQTCRNWDKALRRKPKEPVKGFKDARKVATGF